ncbi:MULTISPECIES: hypothetical protein [unclassified Sphingobacterium]|uniref:hypothetical protein n=1 Tax=unclassified Sphingobacterium TaxID=2609468 RepID=UPI00105188BB|nr:MULTISPECIES: hypothetical protein [unclassified Sphingobacterium]MCS3552737.1 hypothetical protein [Sphingobacterium sp. JUb21]TCR10505.1 hypothetical protein EDF66_101319 [Sphingobacterium sp. JUb20]
MELKQIILNCRNYQPNDEIISVIFAKRIDGQFRPVSDAVLLEVEKEDWAIKITQIATTKYPDYEYFLEMDIAQYYYEDLLANEDYKSDDKKVEAIIHYAEFDA